MAGYQVTERSPAVVITGASSGIGAACACYLSRQGYLVFAGVRQAEDALKVEALGRSQKIQAVIMDVTDAQSLREASLVVDEQLGDAGLVGLVNNAGIALPGPLEHVPMDVVCRQIDVNVTGLIASTQTFLPMIRRGSGRVINIGSTQGLMAFPFFGAYSATKFAVEGISEAFRHELREWGIAVVQIDPSRVRSAIWGKVDAGLDEVWQGLSAPAREDYQRQFDALRKATEGADRQGTDPETVARVVYRALYVNNPKRRYLVGADAKFIALMARFLPGGVRDLLLRWKHRYPGSE